jgi:hypothetical protein
VSYEGIVMEGKLGSGRREPAKSSLFWILWALLILLSVPWYFPPKTYEPMVGGLPLWVVVIIVVTVAYAIFTTVSAYLFWR